MVFTRASQNALSKALEFPDLVDKIIVSFLVPEWYPTLTTNKNRKTALISRTSPQRTEPPTLYNIMHNNPAVYQYSFTANNTQNTKFSIINTLSDILQSTLGVSFKKYAESLYDRNIHDITGIESLTDYDLMNTLFQDYFEIAEWRKRIPYPDNSWQRALYNIEYGKYVLGFEQSDVKTL
eukprot:UN28335